MNKFFADSTFGGGFGAVEFAENPEPRVPCVLIVDTSTSMHGPRIGELNKGLKVYRDELLCDVLAAKRVEVAMVTFGGRVTRKVDFVTATNFQPPTLEVVGGTPMGAAINTALDMIEERRMQYREDGIAYDRPGRSSSPMASRTTSGSQWRCASMPASGKRPSAFLLLESKAPIWKCWRSLAPASRSGCRG